MAWCGIYSQWIKTMNDFTKEELKIIAINLCFNENTSDILNKLNSMIDNYCDHNILVTGNESGHGHLWHKTCRKCGDIIR